MCIVRLVSVLNLFFICILVRPEISAYFVQYFPNPKTWFDAQKFCNRNGGRLATNEDSVDGLYCNKLKGSIGSSGATYWTGKYKTISHWIYKIGCFEILGKPYVSLAHSVSRCFEVCRKQHIKIKLLAHIGNKCACISKNIPNLEKAVNAHRCIDPLDSNNSYWAYKVTRNTTLNGPGNCAFVDCRYKPQKVYTDYCETKRTPLCDNSSRLNWYKSQEKCKYHTTPGDLWDICKTLPTEHHNAWLPMHRVVFWTEVTCDGVGTEDAVTECESFRCYDEGVPSFRANTSCREKANGFFCAFCKSSFSTIINSSTILQSTTSIIVKQKDNGNFTEISEHHATSNIGLIVGVVLGALAITGVIVLGIILKLRKTKTAAKRQNVNQYEISIWTSPINKDKMRKKPPNNKTVNKLYENEGLHAGRPIHVRTKETKIVNEQERTNPNYVNAFIMKNNMTSSMQVGFSSVVASEEAIDSEYDMLNFTPTFLTDNMDNEQYSRPI